MPIDPHQLNAAVRAALMSRLERGMRAGASHIVTILKATVSAPGHGSDLFGPAPGGVFRWHPQKPTEGPYLYGSPLGRTKRRSNQGLYREGAPPYMRSGAGVASICFEVIERDDNAGTVTVRIGVNASAPGGNGLVSYMLAHEKGIRYPTRGPNKGTGPKLFRKWLQPTVTRYMPEFRQIVMQEGSAFP